MRIPRLFFRLRTLDMKFGTRPGRKRLAVASMRSVGASRWLGLCVRVLVLATFVAMSEGCQTATQSRKPPSLSFMWKYRQKFDLALARGDTVGAKAALDKLWSRRVKDELRTDQLEQALLIQRLCAEGGRQLESEDFKAAEATWAGLEQARNRIRDNWTVVWTGVGYPDWMDGEMAGYRGRLDMARDTFAERMKRRFDESLLAKNWGEAERCIAELGRAGMPEGTMADRLTTAKAAEAASAAYAGHLGKGEYSKAEKELEKLESWGIDTAARRREWRDAYVADCENRFSEALARRDYAGAEELFGIFGHLGEDTGIWGGRVKAKRIEDASRDFEDSLSAGDPEEAERALAVLGGLGEETNDGVERIRKLRLKQRKTEFDRALKARNYGAAEALKSVFEELGEDFANYANRIRLERVAEIREGLPSAWERKDIRAVRKTCEKLVALGDATGDEERRLGEMFAEEQGETVVAIRKAADGVWTPDFKSAETSAAAFKERWNGVLSADTGAIDETLRVVRKKFTLRKQSTEGPLVNGCPEYWLRCSPELLLEEDPDACIEGLYVHLAGVAENVCQSAEGAAYKLVGLYGGMLDVEVEAGARMPLSRQWIYLMAAIQRKSGGIVLKELRHAALGPPKKPLSAEHGRRLDEGGYEFLLENCFREFGHAPEGKQLEALDLYDWLGGKRTKAEEFTGR